MYCTVPLKPLGPFMVGGRVATIDGPIVSPRDRSGRGGRRGGPRRQSEVEQLDVDGACGRTPTSDEQHDVARLQIAVDDAGAVRAIERMGDLDRNRECFID